MTTTEKQQKLYDRLAEMIVEYGAEGAVLIMPNEVGPEVIDIALMGSKWEKWVKGAHKAFIELELCKKCGRPLIHHTGETEH